MRFTIKGVFLICAIGVLFVVPSCNLPWGPEWIGDFPPEAAELSDDEVAFLNRAGSLAISDLTGTLEDKETSAGVVLLAINGDRPVIGYKDMIRIAPGEYEFLVSWNFTWRDYGVVGGTGKTKPVTVRATLDAGVTYVFGGRVDHQGETARASIELRRAEAVSAP